MFSTLTPAPGEERDASGLMVVLGGGAFSYERGTPVGEERDGRRPVRDVLAQACSISLALDHIPLHSPVYGGVHVEPLVTCCLSRPPSSPNAMNTVPPIAHGASALCSQH